MIPRWLLEADRRGLPTSEVAVLVVGSGVAGLAGRGWAGGCDREAHQSNRTK